MSELALLGGRNAVSAPLPRWPVWDGSDEAALMNVLHSGKWWMYAYGEGELSNDGAARSERSQVEQFEDEFAALHRVKYGRAVTNGSVALDVCMRAIGLQAGDEVITTPYTFFATSGCILNANALPVYVDIDPETYNLDPKRIEEAITERTRAILPVYFSGEIADMDAIRKIADRHHLRVIEDAAQSQGASLRGGRYAGSLGDAAIFSFQESKCLTCGEGGLILTNSEEMAEAAWSLRHYGRSRTGLWYEHHRLAWNSRMSELQAALLRSQLRRLPEQNATRMKNVKYFLERVQKIEGITPVKLHSEGETHSHYLVMLRYDSQKWDGLPRARFVEALGAEGVPASAGYSFPSFENPIFRNLDVSSSRSVYMLGRSHAIDYRSFAERCPVAIRACREEAIWLMHPLFLGTTREVDMILDAFIKIRSHHRELLS